MIETSLINCLMEKENEIIKSYENYLQNSSNDNSNSRVEECISRHNNHIKALKNISRR